MSINRLQVTQVENNQNKKTSLMSRVARRQEIQATMERLWLKDPEQFNPERDAVQRERISNTVSAIKKYILPQGKRGADLGCGSGVMTRLLRDEGAKMDAVDIANNALDLLKAKDLLDINPIQDCLPSTKLEDNAYDIVVCTEVIGYLDPKEYRLLFAELSRLVNKDGVVACSTSLDLNSENALERFAALSETEFEIEEWILGYHLLWIKCCHFFEIPEIFIKASCDDFERNKELKKRILISNLWFKFNTYKPIAFFWRIINLIAKPIAFHIRQSQGIVFFLEKLTKLLWDEPGISHALFIGKRRPLAFPLPPNEIPIEIKHKRQVWN